MGRGIRVLCEQFWNPCYEAVLSQIFREIALVMCQRTSCRRPEIVVIRASHSVEVVRKLSVRIRGKVWTKVGDWLCDYLGVSCPYGDGGQLVFWTTKEGERAVRPKAAANFHF